ncbi:MAG: UvrD-helicase domain-containing protein, partial [Gammaproteobacteria bacterium]|nr:UvrD-helicase domain-containing protein [Gammaproteobacteria bacterium]
MVGSRATSDKAVLDLTRSFVVQGAAGSGKSELAFQRYLVALGDAKQPEEVLFLAADESSATLIRQRVAAILRGEGGDAPVANRDAEANWSLLEQPERLQIHTIGSLSLALVAAAPVSSGCGAGARITANPDAYYRTAARGLLRTLDHDERVAPNLESLLLHLDNDLLRA